MPTTLSSMFVALPSDPSSFASSASRPSVDAPIELRRGRTYAKTGSIHRFGESFSSLNVSSPPSSARAEQIPAFVSSYREEEEGAPPSEGRSGKLSKRSESVFEAVVR